MPKNYRIVRVEWNDSAGSSRWKSLKDHQDDDCSRCQSVGYLVKTRHDRINLVQSVDDQTENADNGLCIPRSAVIKIEELGKIKFPDEKRKGKK